MLVGVWSRCRLIVMEHRNPHDSFGMTVDGVHEKFAGAAVPWVHNSIPPGAIAEVHIVTAD